jgi:uncharacterized DUF497 family protein
MVYNYLVSFEFDEAKSQKNKEKHGIDFIEAQLIWNAPYLEVPLINEGEERWLIIGMIGFIHWSAIITRRNTHLRIISVRRSRDEEKNLLKKISQKENHEH